MTTAFKSNPGLNPAALPEWRKMVRAVNELERHKVVLSGKVAAQSRTLGNTIGSTAQALADIGPVSFDERLGNAPTALGAVATGYFDGLGGNPSAQVVLTWTAPTTYADGSAFTASGYEVWRALSGGEWQFITRVTTPSATLVRQPFGGAAYQYEVRAQSADNGLYGAFSTPVSVTPPRTLPALPAPDAPTLATSLGIVTATWDGLLGGATPPPGFRGVYAEVSTDGGTTWSQAGQNLLVGGTGTALGPYNDGQAIKVRLRAVDATSQATGASAVVSITVVGVTGPQIVANSITTNQIKTGQITSALISTTGLTGITVTGSVIQTSATASRGIKLSGSTLIGYNSTGTATFTMDGSTGAVTIVGLNATTATISGAITATSGAITGTMTVSGTLQTGSSGARVAITSAGLAGYDSTGAQTFSFLTSNGNIVADSATLTNATVTGAITATTGSIAGQLTIGSSGSIFTGSTAAGQASTKFSTSGLQYTITGTMIVSLGQVVDSGITTTGMAFNYSNNSKYAVIGLGTDGYMNLRSKGGIFASYWDGGANSQSNQLNIDSNGMTMTAMTNGILLQAQQVTFSGGFETINRTTDFHIDDDGSPRIWSQAIMNRNYSQASSNGVSSSTLLAVVTSAGTIGTLNGGLFLPDVYGRVRSARAMFIQSDGSMGTTASSRRVKKNIRPLKWDDETMRRWLAIQPHSFEYKGEAAEGNPGTHHGIIAEDAHDAGFTQMVYYDEREGKNKGRVDGFAYERMGVYDHLALGRLYDELMSLRQRVTELEGSR